jgi:hypothetical protein
MIDHICRYKYIENTRFRLPALALTERNYPRYQESGLTFLQPLIGLLHCKKGFVSDTGVSNLMVFFTAQVLEP